MLSKEMLQMTILLQAVINILSELLPLLWWHKRNKFCNTLQKRKNEHVCTKLQNSCLIENGCKKNNSLWAFLSFSSPPVPLFPSATFLYVSSALPFFLVFKVWNTHLNAIFLWQLIFFFSVGLFFVYNLMLKQNLESLAVYQKKTPNQCCL